MTGGRRNIFLFGPVKWCRVPPQIIQSIRTKLHLEWASINIRTHIWTLGFRKRRKGKGKKEQVGSMGGHGTASSPAGYMETGRQRGRGGERKRKGKGKGKGRGNRERRESSSTTEPQGQAHSSPGSSSDMEPGNSSFPFAPARQAKRSGAPASTFFGKQRGNEIGATAGSFVLSQRVLVRCTGHMSPGNGLRRRQGSGFQEVTEAPRVAGEVREESAKSLGRARRPRLRI